MINLYFTYKFCLAHSPHTQAKLKSHIHDPNAPELVHFLFSPLTLIVEASHESNTVPNLPARVIAPLLTYDAIELLSNCLSSKETELWHSLGDAWHTPKYVKLISVIIKFILNEFCLLLIYLKGQMEQLCCTICTDLYGWLDPRCLFLPRRERRSQTLKCILNLKYY